MATFNGAPMDEIQWRLEEAVVHFGGIRAENIHLYFLASPFCESSSNNKALENQLRFQADSFRILQDRTEFEAALQRMNGGVEYVVTDGPRITPTKGDWNPVWTIRKQRRTKHPSTGQQGLPDRLDVLATYYAIGENIYQAPSVMDILSNRMMTIEDNLRKSFNTAASMQYFSPSQGHRFLLESASTSGKDVSSVRGSRVNTPMPDEVHIPTPKSGQAIITKPVDDVSAREHNALMRSLNLSIRYGSKYVDTNPLLGEPGSLVFTSTDSHLQAQALAKAKAAAEKLAKETKTSPPNVTSPTIEPKIGTSRVKVKSEKTIAGTQAKKRRRSKYAGGPEDE